MTPTSCLGFLFLGPVLPLLGCVCTLQQQRAVCSHAVRQTQQVSRSTRFRLGTDIVYLGVTVVHEASCLARLSCLCAWFWCILHVSSSTSSFRVRNADLDRELRLARRLLGLAAAGMRSCLLTVCCRDGELLKWHAERGHVSSVGYHVAVRIRCRETRMRSEAAVGMAHGVAEMFTVYLYPRGACMPSRLPLPITTTLSQAVD